jgi:hypothetical protein
MTELLVETLGRLPLWSAILISPHGLATEMSAASKIHQKGARATEMSADCSIRLLHGSRYPIEIISKGAGFYDTEKRLTFSKN